MSYIEVKNLSVYLKRKCIVNNVSFSVKRGEIIALLGENGGGKTTLMKGLCSLLKTTGEVYIDDVLFTNKNNSGKKNLISYIPQRDEINFHIEVIEVVLMGFYSDLGVFERYNVEMRKKALEILTLVGMAERAEEDFLTLSEGQKQLVILARALVQDRSVLIFDEPDSAMDFNNKHIVLQKIRSIVDKNKCSLLCLHDANFALKYCDRALLVKDRKIVYDLDIKNSHTVEIKQALSLIYDGINVHEIEGSTFMLKTI